MKHSNLVEAPEFIITNNDITYQQKGYSNFIQTNTFNHLPNKQISNPQKCTPYIPQPSFHNNSPNIRP